jgi:hypothetical protein
MITSTEGQATSILKKAMGGVLSQNKKITQTKK